MLPETGVQLLTGMPLSDAQIDGNLSQLAGLMINMSRYNDAKPPQIRRERGLNHPKYLKYAAWASKVVYNPG